MAMPADLVLVRHEQSEANRVQKMYKGLDDVDIPSAFFERHDSQMRLSATGRDRAPIIGAWLIKEFPEGFDKYWTSDLSRAKETAGRLAISGAWELDDRWRERDWGEYGVLSPEEQSAAQYALSTKLKNQSKWYWCPSGGESLASGVSLRFKDLLGTMHRELPGKRVIAVSHGETIEVGRKILEKLSVDTWEEQQADPSYRVENGQVLHYSRRNPVTGETGPHIEWRRSVCPWDFSKSWHEGQWIKIERQKYSDQDLIDMVELHPPLFD